MAEEDNAYILGVLDGEGYMYPRFNQVGLGAADLDFIQRFKKSLEVFSNENLPEIKVMSEETYNRKKIYRLQVHRISIIKKLQNLTYTETRQNKIKYLEGLFDSDEHAQFILKNGKYKELNLGITTTTTERIYLKAKKYFEDLGIELNKTRIEGLESGKIVCRLRPNCRRSSVEKFDTTFTVMKRKTKNIKRYLGGK